MLGIQHEFAGGIIGAIFGLWLIMLDLPILALGGFMACIFGSNLPDIIDPPLNPFHRSIGHSILSLFIFLLAALIGLTLSIITQSWIFIIPTGFFFAFLSHLFMDLTSPMGLPMFVGKSIFGIIQIPLYLIPIVNIVMIIITLFFGFYSIKYSAKQIGGKWTLILLLMPVWGTLLLLGIALIASSYTWTHIMGYLSFIISASVLAVAIGTGQFIDRGLKNRSIQIKKQK